MPFSIAINNHCLVSVDSPGKFVNQYCCSYKDPHNAEMTNRLVKAVIFKEGGAQRCPYTPRDIQGKWKVTWNCYIVISIYCSAKSLRLTPPPQRHQKQVNFICASFNIYSVVACIKWSRIIDKMGAESLGAEMLNVLADWSHAGRNLKCMPCMALNIQVTSMV